VRLRWGILLCLLLALTGAVSAGAEEPDQVKLRRWYLGLQANGGGRDRWEVFGREDLPPAAVDNDGGGGGFLFGYRFGDRFLLGLQLAVTRHDMVGVPERLFDVEALVTGTVLFRERSTFQPFVRGGFGAGSVVLERPGGNGNTTSLGTATILGAGFQIRLSSRFSLEWEIAGTFTNFLEVFDNPDVDDPYEDWRVKTSHMGIRNGIGLMIWF
jgi:hypothetical protein